MEERGDGVYIKVSRESAAAVSFAEILSALDAAMVVNADAQRIAEVVKRGRGGFEKIGPLFEFYNQNIEQYVDVAVTPLKAVMKISSLCLTDNVKPSLGTLIICLHKKGIKFGVKNEIVSGVLQNALFDKEIVVAEGRAPVAGADAAVSMEVIIDHTFKPLEKNDGTVDFRNINTITQIKNGQVIAKKIPAGKGEAGRAVTGEEIPANPGKDTGFTGGKNTRISDDGLFLLAAKSGFVYKDGEMIHVGDLLPIPKDVDFSVGNIKYSGDIQIQGSVLPGFSVETEGAVTIHGQIEAAKIISRNANVVIQKGIIGKGECFVSGKTGIITEFVQDAILVSDGVVAINKFCMNSDITCEAFEAKEAHGLVLGGTIKAYSRIEVFQAGNDKGIPTKLALVDKNEAANKEKLKELEVLRKKLDDALEPIKKQLRTKAAILKSAGGTSSRMSEELKKWINLYNDLTMKLKFVDKNICDIKEKLKNPVVSDGYIKVAGNLYPGVELSFFGITKVIKNTMSNKIFRFKEGAIGAEG